MTTSLLSATPRQIEMMKRIGVVVDTRCDQRELDCLRSTLASVRRELLSLQKLVTAIAVRCDEIVGHKDPGVIINVVAMEFGVSAAALTGRSKIIAVIQARMAAVALYSRLSGGSTKDIMRAFGYGHHGSVNNAIHSAEDLYDTDAVFRAKFQRCERLLLLRNDNELPIDQALAGGGDAKGTEVPGPASGEPESTRTVVPS